MEAVLSDKECGYYMKLIIFIHGIGMEVLHTYFEQNILNAKEHLEFYMFLNENKHTLFHECYPRVECCKCSQNCHALPSQRGCLTKNQFMLLFEIGPLTEMDHYQTGRHNEIAKECLCRIIAKRSNDVDCMDITLMYAIIQSCACYMKNNTAIHGNPRCIEAIKDTRNFLAHVPNLRISKSEFDTRWAETEQAILEIGSSLGNYFAKGNQKKIDAFKRNDVSIEGIKEIIENNIDEIIKKKLQTFIEDQRKNTMMIKDEIIEQLTKYKDELSIEIRNLIFEVKQDAVASCSVEKTFDSPVPQKNAAACGSNEEETQENTNVRKRRVEWKLETPSTWNLPEIKDTLKKFSAQLRQWFEIENVFVGSLVIQSLVQQNVLDNRDEFRASVHLFLEKFVEVCRINADVPTVIKVTLIIELGEFEKEETEAVIKCENCKEKDYIISGLKEKIYEMSKTVSAVSLDSDVSEKKDDTKEAQAAIERQPSLIELRNYQQELAEIALRGKNTMICAGTNAGKTYVAFHVIESHLLKTPKGKVVFINKTNVLLGQQYSKAIDIYKTLHFQGKIKIWRPDEDDNDDFEKGIEKANVIFMTPKSLCNHLIETAAVKVSIDKFTLIILDECHHTHDKSVYNELMSFYRIGKYRENLHRLPQILGLTASPGTTKAKDVASAKDHLRKVMANLDVSELSVVKRNKEELLQYTSIPEKVSISSTTRKKDPIKDILFDAMEYVEHKLNSQIVSNFLTENLHDSMDLYEALGNPPLQRTDVRYIQWIAETKEKVEHVLHKDPKVPRLLHACLRHLELYTECLEINSLLEIDQVRDVISQRYADESFSSQVANTNEEREIVLKLRDVFADIREIGRNIEGNPDILAVVERIESEYKELKQESRFIIFVKTRATARTLSERLPDYLRSTYLTGSHKSVEEGGRPPDEQIDVLEKFRSGDHLCIVSTSVGCEGLDVPQCNMMIRYRFSADEISSLQMRGSERKREGREKTVGTTKEFETEMKNIQRQYLMTLAIEEVSKLNIARDIAIAEKNIYEMEEIERRAEKKKLSQKRRGLFSVNCKYCGVVITDGDLMRHVNEKIFFVCDKTMLARVEKRLIAKRKQKEFEGFKMQGKAYGLECGHNWGSIIIYKEREFVALSQDYVKIFDRQADKFINCEKWYDLKFKIEEMSDDDFISYNTQLA